MAGSGGVPAPLARLLRKIGAGDDDWLLAERATTEHALAAYRAAAGSESEAWAGIRQSIAAGRPASAAAREKGTSAADESTEGATDGRTHHAQGASYAVYAEARREEGVPVRAPSGFEEALAAPPLEPAQSRPTQAFADAVLLARVSGDETLHLYLDADEPAEEGPTAGNGGGGAAQPPRLFLARTSRAAAAPSETVRVTRVLLVGHSPRGGEEEKEEEEEEKDRSGTGGDSAHSDADGSLFSSSDLDDDEAWLEAGGVENRRAKRKNKKTPPPRQHTPRIAKVYIPEAAVEFDPGAGSCASKRDCEGDEEGGGGRRPLWREVAEPAQGHGRRRARECLALLRGLCVCAGAAHNLPAALAAGCEARGRAPVRVAGRARPADASDDEATLEFGVSPQQPRDASAAAPSLTAVLGPGDPETVASILYDGAGTLTVPQRSITVTFPPAREHAALYSLTVAVRYLTETVGVNLEHTLLTRAANPVSYAAYVAVLPTAAQPARLFWLERDAADAAACHLVTNTAGKRPQRVTCMLVDGGASVILPLLSVGFELPTPAAPVLGALRVLAERASCEHNFPESLADSVTRRLKGHEPSDQDWTESLAYHDPLRLLRHNDPRASFPTYAAFLDEYRAAPPLHGAAGCRRPGHFIYKALSSQYGEAAVSAKRCKKMADSLFRYAVGSRVEVAAERQAAPGGRRKGRKRPMWLPAVVLHRRKLPPTRALAHGAGGDLDSERGRAKDSRETTRPTADTASGRCGSEGGLDSERGGERGMAENPRETSPTAGGHCGSEGVLDSDRGGNRGMPGNPREMSPTAHPADSHRDSEGEPEKRGASESALETRENEPKGDDAAGTPKAASPAAPAAEESGVGGVELGEAEARFEGHLSDTDDEEYTVEVPAAGGAAWPGLRRRHLRPAAARAGDPADLVGKLDASVTHLGTIPARVFNQRHRDALEAGDPELFPLTVRYEGTADRAVPVEPSAVCVTVTSVHCKSEEVSSIDGVYHRVEKEPHWCDKPDEGVDDESAAVFVSAADGSKRFTASSGYWALHEGDDYTIRSKRPATREPTPWAVSRWLFSDENPYHADWCPAAGTSVSVRGVRVRKARDAALNLSFDEHDVLRLADGPVPLLDLVAGMRLTHVDETRVKTVQDVRLATRRPDCVTLRFK
ncbi:hypothetical protein DIPPA_02816 [Diplonema papillatum]|nr:hypothetical protein DIPPA_02816 [Diplonema papillatum]